MRYLAAMLFVLVGTAQAAERPMIFSHPAISAKQVAFGYAGDLWVVDREGGDARRMTSGVGLETHPVFSPDGTQLTFAGEYDGNLDVYVVPIAGGEPRRLTSASSRPGPACGLDTRWQIDPVSIYAVELRQIYPALYDFGHRWARNRGRIAHGGGRQLFPRRHEARLRPFYQYTSLSRSVHGVEALKTVNAPFIWIADLKSLDIEKVPRHELQRF